MRRTKQTQKMIDYVNMYLEKNHITDDFTSDGSYCYV